MSKKAKTEATATTEQVVGNIMAAGTAAAVAIETNPTNKLNTLADLQAICQKTLEVEFSIDNKPFRIECRRLKPSEDAVLEEMLNAVFPPTIKGRTPEDDRPNLADPNFIKARQQTLLQARALALYWCVPIFNAGKPGLVNAKEIYDYIQGVANADVLTVLWNLIRDGGIKRVELVNFTTPNG